MAERIILRDFFYGIIVFAIAAGSIISILGLLRTGGENPAEKAEGLTFTAQDEKNFNDSFNKIDEVTSAMDSVHKNITGITAETENPLGILSIGGAFLSSAWTAVKALTGFIGIIDGAIGSIAIYLDIPIWLPKLITLFLVGIMVFSIISLLFGKDV